MSAALAVFESYPRYFRLQGKKIISHTKNIRTFELDAAIGSGIWKILRASNINIYSSIVFNCWRISSANLDNCLVLYFGGRAIEVIRVNWEGPVNHKGRTNIMMKSNSLSRDNFDTGSEFWHDRIHCCREFQKLVDDKGKARRMPLWLCLLTPVIPLYGTNRKVIPLYGQNGTSDQGIYRSRPIKAVITEAVPTTTALMYEKPDQGKRNNGTAFINKGKLNNAVTAYHG